MAPPTTLVDFEDAADEAITPEDEEETPEGEKEPEERALPEEEE